MRGCFLFNGLFRADCRDAEMRRSRVIVLYVFGSVWGRMWDSGVGRGEMVLGEPWEVGVGNLYASEWSERFLMGEIRFFNGNCIERVSGISQEWMPYPLTNLNVNLLN